LDEGKSKHAWLGSGKMVLLLQNVISLVKAGERHRKAMHLLQKSVINMI